MATDNQIVVNRLNAQQIANARTEGDEAESGSNTSSTA